MRSLLVLVVPILAAVIRFCACEIDDKVITTCKEAKSADEVEECLKNMLNDYRQVMKEDNPRVSVPSLDPVVVGDVHLNARSPDFRVKGDIFKLKLFGFSNIVMDEIDVDYETKTFTAQGHFPEFRGEGDYKWKASLGVIRINGDGNFWINMNGLNLTASTHFFVEEIDSTPRLQINDTSLDLGIDYESMTFYFYNLLKDKNQAMNNAANGMLMVNREEIISVLIPQLSEHVAGFVENTCNEALKTIDIDDMGGADQLKRVFHL